MSARRARALLRVILLAALAASTFSMPAAAAPRAQFSPVVPVLSIFSALSARNRVYRSAEEFIADRNAYYDRLRDTARRQLVEREVSSLRPSQVAAYTKLVASIEQERAGTLAVAENLKREAHQEFQQRLQNAVTSALLGTGPAQRLVGVLKNGIGSARDAIDAALNELSGAGGGVFAQVARARAVAERVNLVAGNIGGPHGAALRRAAARVTRITDNVELVQADLRAAARDLERLSGSVEEIEQAQRAVTGSVTGREAGIFVLTGETDNPVLQAIVGILSRKSTDASGLRQTAREKINEGFVARCRARAGPLLQAPAELRDGLPAGEERAARACQSLEQLEEEAAAPASKLATLDLVELRTLKDDCIAGSGTGLDPAKEYCVWTVEATVEYATPLLPATVECRVALFDDWAIETETVNSETGAVSFSLTRDVRFGILDGVEPGERIGCYLYGEGYPESLLVTSPNRHAELEWID